LLERAIVGPLSGRREAAAGELAALQVIADALATNAFAGAGFIRTSARLEVLRFVAFHGEILFFARNGLMHLERLGYP
jgi:hypothetical protein